MEVFTELDMILWCSYKLHQNRNVITRRSLQLRLNIERQIYEKCVLCSVDFKSSIELGDHGGFYGIGHDIMV